MRHRRAPWALRALEVVEPPGPVRASKARRAVREPRLELHIRPRAALAGDPGRGSRRQLQQLLPPQTRRPSWPSMRSGIHAGTRVAPRCRARGCQTSGQWRPVAQPTQLRGEQRIPRCSAHAVPMGWISMGRLQDLCPRMLADAELRTNEMSRVTQSRRARVRHSQVSLQRRDVIRVRKSPSVVWATSRTPTR